jgi:hypothetical protein
MLRTLFSKLSGFLALIGAGVALFFIGRRDATKDKELDDVNEYIETQRRINEADAVTNRDDALTKLRDNNQLR